MAEDDSPQGHKPDRLPLVASKLDQMLQTNRLDFCRFQINAGRRVIIKSARLPIQKPFPRRVEFLEYPFHHAHFLIRPSRTITLPTTLVLEIAVSILARDQITKSPPLRGVHCVK